MLLLLSIFYNNKNLWDFLKIFFLTSTKIYERKDSFPVSFSCVLWILEEICNSQKKKKNLLIFLIYYKKRKLYFQSNLWKENFSFYHLYLIPFLYSTITF